MSHKKLTAGEQLLKDKDLIDQADPKGMDDNETFLKKKADALLTHVKSQEKPTIARRVVSPLGIKHIVIPKSN